MSEISFIVPPDQLPENLNLPAAYTAMIASSVLPEMMPLWFLAENERLSLFWHRSLKEQYPTRSLIPFAKWDPSDDLACFDGSDTSGDPAVELIHAYTTAGWEARGRLPNFQAWLDEAADSKNVEADAP